VTIDNVRDVFFRTPCTYISVVRAFSIRQKKLQERRRTEKSQAAAAYRWCGLWTMIVGLHSPDGSTKRYHQHLFSVIIQSGSVLWRVKTNNFDDTCSTRAIQKVSGLDIFRQ